MPRATNSVASRRRRKKVLKLTKGYWGAKSKLYRTAHEAMMKALSYAYREFIRGLKVTGVEINRKILAELAVRNHEAFVSVVKVAKEGLN